MRTRFLSGGLVCFVMMCGFSFGQMVEVIHSFDGTNGAYPESLLLLSSNRNFYGVTEKGGASDLGTIFEINAEGGFRSLLSFNGTNGSTPRGRLVESSNGYLYGTTSLGGASNSGTVFKVTTNGALTTLFSFGGASGSVPRSGLTQWTNGDFYGTTFGTYQLIAGTIFRMTPEGTLTTLKTFSSSGADGRGFYSGLTLGPDGNFYGVDAQSAVPPNLGTIYRVTHDGEFNVVFRFDGTNGRAPMVNLVLGSDSNFYGTTSRGGASGLGTLFRFATNGQLTMLFTLSDGSNTGIGQTPDSDLLREDNGDIYGLTQAPVAIGNGWGLIFKLAADGTIFRIHAFDTASGPMKRAGLIRGNDGNLYSQSPTGGAFLRGFVYRLLMAPKLKAEMEADGLVLSWPTNFAGYTLQSVVELNSDSEWIDSTELPRVEGADFVMTNAVSSEAKYFRLRK